MRRLDGNPRARREFRAVRLTKQVRRCTTEELIALADRLDGELEHRIKHALPVEPGVVRP